jgi:chromate transporter
VTEAGARGVVSFREALAFWLRLGFISFGGPAGQIAILHRETVERRKWIDEASFSRALAFCTFLPGPEAQQLATWIGWSLHGTRGALAAGVLFFLPAAVLLLGLSWARAAYERAPFVEALLAGFRPVVAAIILDAVIAMMRRRLTTTRDAWLAAAALGASLAQLSFPLAVAAAGLVGLVGVRAPGERETPAPRVAIQPGRAARIVVIALLLWLAPFAAIAANPDVDFFTSVYLFFSRAAFITFGGAYAVLGYVTTAAVGEFQWLTNTQAVDGLALAETTPGPLIIVLQYVGFFAGWNHGGAGGSPFFAGALAAFLTTWATFLPSITFVLLGAPYVERLTSTPRLAGAFHAIGVAATGFVLALGLRYTAAAIASPGPLHSPFVAIILMVIAFAGLRSGKLTMGLAIVLALAAGFAAWLVHSI